MDFKVVVSLLIGTVFGSVFTMIATACLMKMMERISKDIEEETRIAREFDHDEFVR